MASLEKWSLVGLDGAKPLAVRGEIHGDERFSDGTPITSSRLCNLDPAGHFACTKNHTYELGVMSDAFARWMAANGRSITSFAAALERTSAAKSTRSTVTSIDDAPSAPRPAPPTPSVATRIAAPSATQLVPSSATQLVARSATTQLIANGATSLVPTPTRLVATR